MNVEKLPKDMFVQNVPITAGLLPDTFANFFDKKIQDIVGNTAVDDAVYNGRKIVTASNQMFMDRNSIRECVSTLKLKNCEGFDRIPQRILVDGIDELIEPLTHLFELVYVQGSIYMWNLLLSFDVIIIAGICASFCNSLLILSMYVLSISLWV